MAIRATRPATPAAVAGAVAEERSAGPLESAPTVPPPAEPSSDARIPPGTVVSGRYRISRVLGEGGMGVVYAAEHVLMRKEVALKVLHAEMCTMPEVVARFEREAITAAHIDHPNVAGATDFGRLEDGSCFLVLELLRGASLRDEILRGPIPLARTLHILRGIASGVAAAHAKGIVHRDLKPENVMLVERDGIPDFVKVLDFGIAKVDATLASSPHSVGQVLTRVGSIFGTPEYMAPEQAIGDTVDARADLYAIGVMFLEMLTGKCPFTGNALSILRERILAVGPPDMSGITDPSARSLAGRLLTRQPEDRMQTASELGAAIDAMLGEGRGSALPSPALTGPLLGVPGTSSASGMATAMTNPLVTHRAPSKPARVPQWLMLTAAGAAALAIAVGTFSVVTSALAPKSETAKTDVPPRAAGTTLPSPTSAAVAPAANARNEAEPAATAKATAEAPAPTASAASARATPKGKPSTRPARPPRKTGPGGIYIPPPREWIK